MYVLYPRQQRLHVYHKHDAEYVDIYRISELNKYLLATLAFPFQLPKNHLIQHLTFFSPPIKISKMPPAKVALRSDQNGIPVPLSGENNVTDIKQTLCTATSVETRVIFTENISTSGCAIASYDPSISAQDDRVNRTLYSSPDYKVPDDYFTAIKNYVNITNKKKVEFIIASPSFAETDTTGAAAWQTSVSVAIASKITAAFPKGGANAGEVVVSYFTSTQVEDDINSEKHSGFALDQDGNWGRVWNGQGKPPTAPSEGEESGGESDGEGSEKGNVIKNKGKDGKSKGGKGKSKDTQDGVNKTTEVSKTTKGGKGGKEAKGGKASEDEEEEESEKEDKEGSEKEEEEESEEEEGGSEEEEEGSEKGDEDEEAGSEEEEDEETKDDEEEEK
jgi:hypothetical protein